MIDCQELMVLLRSFNPLHLGHAEDHMASQDDLDFVKTKRWR
jgi:hypothetical protein